MVLNRYKNGIRLFYGFQQLEWSDTKYEGILLEYGKKYKEGMNKKQAWVINNEKNIKISKKIYKKIK